VSAEENKAVIRRFFDEVVNGQNLDVLDELVAGDVVNHSATEEHKHGIEGFRHPTSPTRAPMHPSAWKDHSRNFLLRGVSVGRII
jgi:ketosteroid isomerase-like protein